jgi:hypothetical protein
MTHQNNPKLYVRFLGIFSIQAEGRTAIRAAMIPVIVASSAIAILLIVAAARAGPELAEALTNRITWMFTRS